jgi:hypothetical protein
MNDTLTTQTVGTIHPSEIEFLRDVQLVALYFELTGASMITPTRREMIAAVRDVVECRLNPPPATCNRRKRFDLACTGRIRSHRPGTARERVIQLLRRGATFGEIQHLFKWDYGTCHNAIWSLHSILGYGIMEDDDGRIWLVEEPRDSLEVWITGCVEDDGERLTCMGASYRSRITLRLIRMVLEDMEFDTDVRNFRCWEENGRFVASWECGKIASEKGDPHEA